MQYPDDDTYERIIRETDRFTGELERLAREAHPLLAVFLEKECESFWDFVEQQVRQDVLNKRRH
ncbi:hypothetical protein GCM10023116_12110 [Kistimonas scapharcae]|uniref:Uncharacterized protein n=1 Tax=Kistimonas scapharcae TaxID=1036133 RepID=A0ABP8UZA1_9GAMM